MPDLCFNLRTKASKMGSRQMEKGTHLRAGHWGWAEVGLGPCRCQCSRGLKHAGPCQCGRLSSVPCVQRHLKGLTYRPKYGWDSEGCVETKKEKKEREEKGKKENDEKT